MADTLSLDIPVKGSADVAEAQAPKATTMSDFSGSVDVSPKVTTEADPEDTTEELEANLSDGDEGTGEGDPSEEDGEEGEAAPDDLPDYDPEDDEVKAAYDAKFFKAEDGSLNRDALSAEFWKAYDATPADKRSEARLPEGVKKFLSDVTGFDAAAIDDITAAVRDQTLTQQKEFKTRFGGDAIVNAALAWGGEHYTEAQKKRFKAAQDRGFNSEEAAEQLEVLISRASKAGVLKGVHKDAKPGEQSEQGQNRRPRRPSSPKRNATASAQAQPTADVFKSVDEFNTAFAEALRSGDQGKIAYVRRKLKRSPSAQIASS